MPSYLPIYTIVSLVSLSQAYRILKKLNLSIVFVLGDAAYDSQDVRETAENVQTMIITPINKRNGTRKSCTDSVAYA